MTLVVTATGTVVSESAATLSPTGASRLRHGPTTNALEMSSNGGDYFPVAGMTPEGGLYTTLVNKTGAPSVRGSLVSASTGTDYAFELQSNEYDAIGVVYDNGVADGSACRVVFAGVADVLLKDTTAATHGQWLGAADTDGRAYAATGPGGGGFPGVTDTHFKEIGHCLQSVGGGSDVLVRAMVHFN